MPVIPLGVVGPPGPQGDQGDQGDQGIQGPPGPTGDSAYAAAVAGGFVGDEASWIASLKGDPGANIYVQPDDPGAVPDGRLWLDTDDTTPDTSLNWGNIAGTLSNQTDLNTALAAKAPLASPALTGTPTAPTPTVGDNSTKLATTAFVAANAAANPLTTKGDLYGYSTTGARVAVGANGQALVADSTQAVGLSWLTMRGVPPLATAIASNIRLSTISHGLGQSGGTINQAVPINTLIAVPIHLPETRTYTQIGFPNIGVASAGGNCRLGVGVVTGNGAGITLLVDAGALSTGATGQAFLTGLTMNLNAGWVVLLMVCDVAFSPMSCLPALGMGQQTTTGAPVGSLRVSATYGALASSYSGLAVSSINQPIMAVY